MVLSLGFAHPVLAESAADITQSNTATESVTTASESSTATTAMSAAQQYVVITGSNVNLRSGAGTSFDKVGKAKKGSRFAYLSSKKAKNGKVWYQVQYSSSITAWVGYFLCESRNSQKGNKIHLSFKQRGKR